MLSREGGNREKPERKEWEQSAQPHIASQANKILHPNKAHRSSGAEAPAKAVRCRPYQPPWLQRAERPPLGWPMRPSVVLSLSFCRRSEWQSEPNHHSWSANRVGEATPAPSASALFPPVRAGFPVL